MEGIFVFGFDSEKGQQLYIDAVKNLTSTGLVVSRHDIAAIWVVFFSRWQRYRCWQDGFFGDKWGSHAAPDPNSTTSGWQICNHECGAVTEQQGRAWNAGKARVLETVTSIVGEGPYFANGGTFTGGKPGQGAGGPGGVTYNGERRRFFLPFALPKNSRAKLWLQCRRTSTALGDPTPTC